MATKKEEPKYIGRYGEVLEDVQEVTDKEVIRRLMAYKDDKDPIKRFFEGTGLDAWGRKRKVMFSVDKRTNKKQGRYVIFDTEIGKEKTPIALIKSSEHVEICNYVNDLLHGETLFGRPSLLGPEKLIHFHRGKKLSETEYEERGAKSEKARDIRKLLSDASVVEAIKTGDPVKVKSAITRAITGTPKRRKSKGMGE